MKKKKMTKRERKGKPSRGSKKRTGPVITPPNDRVLNQDPVQKEASMVVPNDPTATAD